MLFCATVALVGVPWRASPIWGGEPKTTGEGSAQNDSLSFDEYLRIARDDKGEPKALETAIVRFVPADGTREGLSVDLVSAIHVGDRAYYDKLNDEFDQFEVLLYELVAPKGARPPRGGGGTSANPISLLQQTMSMVLGLESQVESVDYHKDHFVHADMSAEEFAQSMKSKNESIFTMVLRAVGQSLAQGDTAEQLNVDEAELLQALTDPGKSYVLKRLMAEQFENSGGALSMFEGPEGSTIITERNKVALAVLKEQIDAGKKNIGIFYGGGHMPDMEQRLMDEFKMKRASVEWIEAWDLREKEGGPAGGFEGLRGLFQLPLPGGGGLPRRP
jgi:hypothetical protein